MKKEYGFGRSKRGPVLGRTGKTRITIYLDNATLERFKGESERTGKGYQTLINEALARCVGMLEQPVTAAEIRNIFREEFAHHASS
jgi:uncharacterized protein (DUF4415 family)